MSKEFSIKFDFDSTQRIKGLEGFQDLFTKHLRGATSDNLKLIQSNVKDAMVFQNPSGKLKQSMHREQFNAYSGQVGTASPYGFRRNYGFSGMTDSLGRFYLYDPGVHFMETGWQRSNVRVQDNYEDAIAESFEELRGMARQAGY